MIRSIIHAEEKNVRKNVIPDILNNIYIYIFFLKMALKRPMKKLFLRRALSNRKGILGGVL